MICVHVTMLSRYGDYWQHTEELIRKFVTGTNKDAQQSFTVIYIALPTKYKTLFTFLLSPIESNRWENHIYKTRLNWKSVVRK